MTQHAAELKKIKDACAEFMPPGAFIAGGALLSAFTAKPINDVDLYFKSRAAFEEAIIDAYDSHLWCVAATDRAVTFVKGDATVQLMHFDFFESPAAVFDAFDFTACMAAYDIDSESFVFHADFFKHAAQRYLSFHSGTRYPFGTLLRVLKYQQRGYTLSKGDLLRIALCCHKTPLASWDDLARAIGGQYGEKVSLQTEEPFSIDAAVRLIQATDFTVPATAEEMPGSGEALLERLQELANPRAAREACAADFA